MRSSSSNSRNELSPHVEALVDKFVPGHIRSEYPQFVEFVRAFLNYLEHEHGSGYYQNTLPNQRDVRDQDTQFLHQLEKEIGLYVPRKYQADPKVFYDRISDLWKAKGSEDAIRTFFTLFLDDPVSIYYPWNQVLIPSDGRWVVDDRLRISVIQGDPNDLVGQTIQQIESLAEAKVNTVERRVYADGDIYELNLTGGSIVGEFIPGSRIQSGNGVVGEVYRTAVDIRIINGGRGYSLGDRIRVAGFEGFTFTAYVSAIDENGSITNVRIANYGAGNTPTHVLNSENPPEYYFKDFLLYRTSDDEFVGPSFSISELVVYGRREDVGLSVTDNQPIQVEGRDGVFTDIDIDRFELSIGTRSGTDIIIPLIIRFITPVFEIDTDEGERAELVLEFDGVATTDGYYDGVKGQLDESIVLQDSRFYQKFSYEVTTNYPSRVWLDALKKTVHPAGMAVFGNIRLSDALDNRISNTTVYTAVTDPPKYILTEKPRVESRPLGFSQDYAVPDDVHFAESYSGTEYFNRITEPYTVDNSDYFASDYLGSEYYNIVLAEEESTEEFVREVSVIQD